MHFNSLNKQQCNWCREDEIHILEDEWLPLDNPDEWQEDPPVNPNEEWEKLKRRNSGGTGNGYSENIKKWFYGLCSLISPFCWGFWRFWQSIFVDEKIKNTINYNSYPKDI